MAEVVYVKTGEGAYYKSRFPHETVTLDLDRDGKLIGIELIGDSAKHVTIAAHGASPSGQPRVRPGG